MEYTYKNNLWGHWEQQSTICTSSELNLWSFCIQYCTNIEFLSTVKATLCTLLFYSLGCLSNVRFLKVFAYWFYKLIQSNSTLRWNQCSLFRLPHVCTCTCIRLCQHRYYLWENMLQLKITLQLHVALPQNLATKIFKIYLQGKIISHPLFRAHMLVNTWKDYRYMSKIIWHPVALYINPG